MTWEKICTRFLVFITLGALFLPEARPQQFSSLDRDRALNMLGTVAKEVQKHYYDPDFHGVDWDATVQKAKQQIKEATSLNMALAHIAQALVSLNDSHTFFLPPPRPYIHDYGFQTLMIGDRCYVVRVRPGTDAEAKGVKPGDEVVAMNGYAPSRETFWKFNYRYNVLRPEPGLRLFLRDLQGQQRQVDVLAKFKQLERVKDYTGEHIWDVIRDLEDQEHLARARLRTVGDDVSVLKFPQFLFEEGEVESMINKARKRPALIVDLRGNPGGAVETLKYFLGGVFEDDVKVADRSGRKETKPEVAKSWKHGAFTGKLVVLVDSDSASASELFARIVQLQKRGTVVGDRSSGSVMESRQYTYQAGADTVVFYGAAITAYDLIMSDGKSLEHTGVTPDELALPTAADLASGRDPVLARAAAMLGSKLTPEDAGKMFPYEWPKEE
jgi:carboxyl-terminal processing protease